MFNQAEGFLCLSVSSVCMLWVSTHGSRGLQSEAHRFKPNYVFKSARHACPDDIHRRIRRLGNNQPTPTTCSTVFNFFFRGQQRQLNVVLLFETPAPPVQQEIEKVLDTRNAFNSTQCLAWQVKYIFRYFQILQEHMYCNHTTLTFSRGIL